MAANAPANGPSEPTLNDLIARHSGTPTEANHDRTEQTQTISARMFSKGDDGSAAGDADEDSWVTTYMDLLTLLLVLFVILLANADLNGSSSPEQQLLQAANTDAGLGTMQDNIEKQFAGAGLGDLVEVSLSPGKLNIKLNDKILFDSGEAEFNQQAATVMTPILQLLNENNLLVSVEGHTDNVPINTARFPSNWELSASRAISVVRYLQTNGIAAKRLRAIGYADSVPLSSNETVNGRSENRRVNLVLSEPPAN
jgi:chemotaxis protein MotB